MCKQHGGEHEGVRERRRKLMCPLARTLLVLFSLFLIACGKSRVTAAADASPPASLPEAPLALGPGKPRGPITSESEGLSAFRAAWTEEIAKASTTHAPRGKHWEAPVFAGTPRMHRLPCREFHTRAASSYAASKDDDLLLFDRPSSLARDGECWEIHAQYKMWPEIFGYLDATTGALLHAYMVPEG
jgi:hypothetical protein